MMTSDSGLLFWPLFILLPRHKVRWKSNGGFRRKVSGILFTTSFDIRLSVRRQKQTCRKKWHRLIFQHKIVSKECFTSAFHCSFVRPLTLITHI